MGNNNSWTWIPHVLSGWILVNLQPVIVPRHQVQAVSSCAFFWKRLDVFLRIGVGRKGLGWFSSQLCQTTGVHFISAFSTSFPSQNPRFGRQAGRIHCTWYGTGSSCGAAKATWCAWLHPRRVLGWPGRSLGAGMKKKQRFLCVRFFDLLARGWGGYCCGKSTGSKEVSLNPSREPYACTFLILARMRQPPHGWCHQHPVQVPLAR